MGKSPKDTGGPVVKTGPTAGKNRSRNKDGESRKKRSDSGKSKKSGDSLCFLSTAACQFKGLPDDCYELEVFRDFRDSYLRATTNGSQMVEHYYSVAPEITKHLTEEADLNQIWDVVAECVEAIEAKRYQEAITTYRAMVESMQEKFLN